MLASWHFEWIRAMVVSWACVCGSGTLTPPSAPPPSSDAVCRCLLVPPTSKPLSSSSVRRPNVCRPVGGWGEGSGRGLLHSHLSAVCVPFSKHALQRSAHSPDTPNHPPPPYSPTSHHVCLLLVAIIGTNGASAGGRRASLQRRRAVTPQSDDCWVFVAKVRSLRLAELFKSWRLKVEIWSDLNDLLGLHQMPLGVIYYFKNAR